jgi:ribosomal protein S18 acetylase RimI-like enzyme
MSLLVRRLKIADLPALEQIEAAHLKRFPGRAGWLAGFGKLVERSLSEEPEGIMIAEQDGKVAGSAIARQRGIHPVSGLTFGHIFHLSVAQGPEAKPVAQRLLRECEAYLRSRGCEVVHLSLPADDPSAAELFKTSGYNVAAWELRRSFK